MKAAPFDYVRPASLPAAIEALRDAGGEAKVLAGGQSLVPVLAMRLGRPSLLVDVNRIAGLDCIDEVSAESIRVGALVRHRELVEQSTHQLLAAAARWIGHTAIRARGTAGGSIAHADPAAELPVVAAALAAQIHVAGAQGRRVVVADELFVGPLETTLADDEIITAIDFPRPERWGFAEFSRRHGDFGLVTVVAVEVRGHPRLAIGGVGPVPVRPTAAEQVLTEAGLTHATIDVAARAAAGAVTASTDLHASADYRTAMTEEFTRRALRQMLDTRGGSD